MYGPPPSHTSAWPPCHCACHQVVRWDKHESPACSRIHGQAIVIVITYHRALSCHSRSFAVLACMHTCSAWPLMMWLATTRAAADGVRSRASMLATPVLAASLRRSSSKPCRSPHGDNAASTCLHRSDASSCHWHCHWQKQGHACMAALTSQCQ
jgi:hypothetical protein